MNKTRELIKAIILLPGTVLILIPALILKFSGSYQGFAVFGAAWVWLAVILGICFTGLGLALSFQTVTLFFRAGDGTPAPWAPPKHFVIAGPYRYVRNPMILAVLALLAAESVFLGSIQIGLWALMFFLINTIYFILVEEPGLARRFGTSYLEYRRHVPRWIPRFKPWNP